MLQRPREYCQLPHLSFPESGPGYPSRDEFIKYLELYVNHFGISPQFKENVLSAEYDQDRRRWRVKTRREGHGEVEYIEYICRWLVAATGENAEPIVPKIEGLKDFEGLVMHSCDYRSGESYNGQNVLVVGCQNSGLEISDDLRDHDATPFMVVRNSETRESLEKLKRLEMLPVGLKNSIFEKIKLDKINVVPGIRKFLGDQVELDGGKFLQIDSVILATGYRSNVLSWLKKNELFSDDGIAKGWKGKCGLYAVGLRVTGLEAASWDATNVSQDIAQRWKEETEQKKRPGCSQNRSPPHQFRRTGVVGSVHSVISNELHHSDHNMCVEVEVAE